MATAPASGSSWGAAFAGPQVATALVDNHYQRRLRNINQRLADEQAALTTKVRDARNTAAAAEAGLSRFIQGVNNKRLLDGGARRQAALLGTIALGKEVAASNRADRRLAANFEAGQESARAAFEGGTGGAQDRLLAVMALREARIEQRVSEDINRRSIYLGDQAGAALGEAIAGQDGRTFLPNRDTSALMAQQLPAGPSPLEAAVGSGADMRRLMHGVADLTRYMQSRFKDPEYQITDATPATTDGLAPLSTAALPAGFFDFEN